MYQEASSQKKRKNRWRSGISGVGLMLIAFDSAVGGYSIMLAIHHKNTVIDKNDTKVYILCFMRRHVHTFHINFLVEKGSGAFWEIETRLSILFLHLKARSRRKLSLRLFLSSTDLIGMLCWSPCAARSSASRETSKSTLTFWGESLTSKVLCNVAASVDKQNDIVCNWRSFFCFRDANLSNEAQWHTSLLAIIYSSTKFASKMNKKFL